VNPNPNPADQCCYAFRFDGQFAGSGCILILGEYLNVGGKCKPILDDDGEPIPGQMFLQSAQ